MPNLNEVVVFVEVAKADENPCPLTSTARLQELDDCYMSLIDSPEVGTNLSVEAI